MGLYITEIYTGPSESYILIFICFKFLSVIISMRFITQGQNSILHYRDNKMKMIEGEIKFSNMILLHMELCKKCVY
jgi:hypothetical protein